MNNVKNNTQDRFIIAIRHEGHENNKLSLDIEKRCIRAGKKLKSELLKRKLDLPKFSFCSPQWRSIFTLGYYLNGLQGYKKLDGIYEELGDMSTGLYPYTLKEFERAKARAYKLGLLDPEPFMLSLYPEKSKLRAIESVKLLKKLLVNKGSFLFCSHGCSRLEQITALFEELPVDKPSFYYELGAAAILFFKIRDKKIKFQRAEYLGHLGK